MNRPLWQEALTVFKMTRAFSELVELQAVQNGAFQGQVAKPLPASRYLDSSTITFDFLRECLAESKDCFRMKFAAFCDLFPEMENSPAEGSNRPLGEIVMEARLLSTAPEQTTGKFVSEWLGKSRRR